MEDVLKGKSFKNHSFLQGWNPLPPFSEGPPPPHSGYPPLSEAN